jgi:hypothetical protein
MVKSKTRKTTTKEVDGMTKKVYTERTEEIKLKDKQENK